MNSIRVISHSEEETKGLAARLAGYFRPGDVIILTGELGAGKTVFVRGLAESLGIGQDQVNSPSFTLVNEYAGNIPVFHFDLYRLGDVSELYEIGWDDYLGKDGLTVVEWGEKADGYLPTAYYKIEFKLIDDNDREITVSFVEQ